jgi:hypothetical protein
MSRLVQRRFCSTKVEISSDEDIAKRCSGFNEIGLLRLAARTENGAQASDSCEVYVVI